MSLQTVLTWGARVLVVFFVAAASVVAGAQLREARESAAAHAMATSSPMPTAPPSAAMTSVPSPIPTLNAPTPPPPTPTPVQTRPSQSVPTPTAARATTTISGHVTAGGVAVRLAHVYAYPAENQKGSTPTPPSVAVTETGADGSFQLDVPNGRYRVGAFLPSSSALASDYWMATWSGGAHAVGLASDVIVAGSPQTVDLAFIRSPLVSGRVVAPDGSGVAGAAITAIRHFDVDYSLGDATTDETGAFSFHTVPLAMTVSAAVQGKTQPTWSTVDIDVRTDVTGLRFVVQPGNIITGTLRDASGRALANTNFGAQTTVVCYACNTDTDPQGRFRLTLPDGTMTFHTWPRSGEPMLYSKEYVISASATFDIVMTPVP